MNRRKIKVLLVDDHSIARNGVRLMLGTASDIHVAGEAETAKDATQLIRKNDFDVALLDIALPGTNGLELLKTLRAEKPELAVLMLSMYSEDIYALRAIKHGAAGYLAKTVSTAILVAAVRKAAAGGKHISPELAEICIGVIGGGDMARHAALSDRELEVLKLLATGERLVDIGKMLHLSPSTVTTYRTRIMEKTGMCNNAKLARYALENGVLT